MRWPQLFAHAVEQPVGEQLREDLELARFADAGHAAAGSPGNQRRCLIAVAPMRENHWLGIGRRMRICHLV